MDNYSYLGFGVLNLDLPTFKVLYASLYIFSVIIPSGDPIGYLKLLKFES
jgi:hypothetical protein